MNGYLIFGVNTYKFQSLSRSILQCLLILIGDANASYMVDIDPMMGVVYYLIFMVKDMIK